MKIKKINMIEILKNILILFLLIILGNICYSKFIKKDRIVSFFGKSFLIVTTGSMEPTIKMGELIVVENKNEYKKGDIITYDENGEYFVTHRIIEINQNYFIAKGDYNNLQDEVQNNKHILGKVVYHSYFLGFCVIYLLKPITAIYIIYFIIACIRLKMNKEKCENENKNDSKNIINA